MFLKSTQGRDRIPSYEELAREHDPGGGHSFYLELFRTSNFLVLFSTLLDFTDLKYKGMTGSPRMKNWRGAGNLTLGAASYAGDHIPPSSGFFFPFTKDKKRMTITSKYMVLPLGAKRNLIPKEDKNRKGCLRFFPRRQNNKGKQ